MQGFKFGSGGGLNKKSGSIVGKGNDPLADVEYTGDLAGDAAAELTELESAYRDRAAAEQKRFRRATDSEFWVALCFETREQKEEFLRRVGLRPMRDGDKYLNGKQVARKLGIELEEP